MARDQWREGIVLHCRRMQEFHKSVIFLSRTGGIGEAVLHGAYKGKSRLAGSTESFCRLRLMLYHNPVKDSWKLNDGELIRAYDGFRQDLAKVYLASFWSEILIKTKGGGASSGEEAERIFFLLADSLETLEGLPREQLGRLDAQFLWRFLTISGFGLDYKSCARCGKELEGQAGFFYEPGEHGFVCPGCAGQRGPGHGQEKIHGGLLPPGFLKYLSYSLSKSLAESLRVDLAGASGGPGTGLAPVREIPLDFLKRETGFSFKTPDYRSFL